MEHNGHARRKNTWFTGCACSLRMINISYNKMLRHKHSWTISQAEREELGKQASSARVGLNVAGIESEQDRGELGKEASSARVGLNATESEQDTLGDTAAGT